MRWVAAIIFFVIGAASLAYALNASLSEEAGWKEIEVSSYEENCADEFVLMYNLGVSGESATKENKALSAVYEEAAGTAYRLFNSTTSFDGIVNIAYLNQHPNEEVTVDPALYEAFALLDSYGTRTQYLGPAYESYNGLFNCVDDYQTVDFDPLQNVELQVYFAQVAAYAADSESVELELLGDNHVRLKVSDEYLSFAEENGTAQFLDLSWMQNAFVIDFLADRLAENGYTFGMLSSYDGFVRNLADSDSEDFAFTLFDMQEQTVYPAAVMHYAGPLSLVSLRSYPLENMDLRRYYVLDTGEIRGPYLDTADGLPKAAAANLTSYSKDAGCAEILLRILPCYVGDTFQEEAVIALSGEGIDSVYCRDSVIYHTSDEIRLTDFCETETAAYTAVKAE